MLEKIHSPDDIKSLSYADLERLAADIRTEIIDVVSHNGGHLASNLGIVEATIALHKIFNSPQDRIIFDVGHQCYTHKLLTGRNKRFKTLRQYGGISGFTSSAESEHDPFIEGHCGTSLSAAMGVAVSNKIHGNDHYTIAVIGDGAFTNGMIFEALNNCSSMSMQLIILLNDNEMSISQNTGALHDYFSRIRTSKNYFRLKHKTERFLSSLPFIGKPSVAFIKSLKTIIKRTILKNTLFEDLGIGYLGPVNGNDIEKLCDVLQEAKGKKSCYIVHMTTKKGLGYKYAEEMPDKYHSVDKFDFFDGLQSSENTSFSSEFGRILCEKAKENTSICAITAAMCDGTGLTDFKTSFPDRFFDVGIAEEHAITFASGLCVTGLLPFVALYSTFSQRVFDQLLHDVAIQHMHMVIALDRCGVVPYDGITHQGIFDYALFTSIPGVTIYSPYNYTELSRAMSDSIADTGISIIRYPKGSEGTDGDMLDCSSADLQYTCNIEACDIIVMTYGIITKQAIKALQLLEDKHIGLIKLYKIFPIDFHKIANMTKNASFLYILEDVYSTNSVGEKIKADLYGINGNIKIICRSLSEFVMHGSLDDLYKRYSLDCEHISNELRKLRKQITEQKSGERYKSIHYQSECSCKDKSIS